MIRGISLRAAIVLAQVQHTGWASYNNLDVPAVKSQVYNLLGRLRRQGLILGKWDTTGERPIRRYVLTHTGRAALEEIRAALSPAGDNNTGEGDGK